MEKETINSEQVNENDVKETVGEQINKSVNKETVSEETINFEELGIIPEIARAVSDMGFEKFSPIQEQSIPVQLEGKDIIGQAQTGTGKTAAFGIPLLQQINKNDRHLQAIILCPTRELAIQVSDEIRKLAKYINGIKTVPIYGGQDIVRQIRTLKTGAQIMVGTPGRVMDHMRRKTVKFDHVHKVILDEADEMLNMGFVDDIKTILEQVPQERQTVLFSATMPQEIKDIAKNFQNNPVTVKVIKKELTVPKIEQYYYMVKQKNKLEVMSRLLDIYNPKLSLVFCNTKKQVDELVVSLQDRGYFAEGLHGDLKQSQRDRVMGGFRNGRTQILVATDVAARGIDVDDVEAVFNYDIPQDDEYYVHRIGRTGRAGRTGFAFSLVVGKEIYKLREIQRYCKTKINEQSIPSASDVTNTKVNNLLKDMERIIKEDNISNLVNSIEREISAQSYNSVDLAAALLKSMIGEQKDEKDDILFLKENEWKDKLDRPYKSAKRNNYRENYKDKSNSRLFINIGKSQGVKPGDILGAISGESGVPGKLVGSIDMYDKYTFVDVPRNSVSRILNSMKMTKIKGKNVNIELANRR